MSDAVLKRLVGVCVLAAAPGLAIAQASPATSPAAPSSTSPAAKSPLPLGRMFFTPAQHTQLDVARTQRARTTLATEQTEEAPTTAAPVAQSITYDGMVRRSDGKSTVFLNSRPV